MISLKDTLALNLLEEGSFLPADIPEFFYCAAILKPENEQNIMQFVNRKLNGIQGITESKKVASDFIGESSRNVLLVMNGAATVSQNRLSKILYKNPDYLVSQHLKIADRITANKLYTDMTFVSVMKELLFYLHAKIATKHLALQLENDIPILIKNFRQAKGKFDDIKSLARWILTNWQKLHPETELEKLLPYEKIIAFFSKMLKSDMNAFLHEKEWIVKDKVLNIPQKSLLVFYAPYEEELVPFMQITKKFNLKNEYEVQFKTI